MGQTDPTRRWREMKKGLTTLDFRVHKGVHVPTAEEVAYMKLGQLQKPHATRMKELAADRKIREMLLGKAGIDSQHSTEQHDIGKSLWGKAAKRRASFCEGDGGTLPEEKSGAGEHCLSDRRTSKGPCNPDPSESNWCESSWGDDASGISLWNVSSMGIGQMGVVDVVDAGFQAQELREAERRQVTIRPFHACSPKLAEFSPMNFLTCQLGASQLNIVHCTTNFEASHCDFQPRWCDDATSGDCCCCPTACDSACGFIISYIRLN